MCRPRRPRAQGPASRSALHGPGLEAHPPERSREQPQPLRTLRRAADLGGRLPQPPPTTGRGVKVGYALRARLRLRWA